MHLEDTLGAGCLEVIRKNTPSISKSLCLIVIQKIERIKSDSSLPVQERGKTKRNFPVHVSFDIKQIEIFLFN